MKRTLFLLGTAREASTRLAKKMVRPFAGTTLFDIYMKKFEVLRRSNLFCGCGMAVPTSDKELLAIAQKYDVPMIAERPRENPAPIARNKELYYLKDIDATHIMWVNGCLPMMRVFTIWHPAWRFLCTPSWHSLEPVFFRRNWFYRRNGQPLNHHATSLQKTEAVAESHQGFHIFSRDFMLRTSRYFQGGRDNDPHLCGIPKTPEMRDIDTETQFRKAEGEFEECDQEVLYAEIAPYANNSR